MGVSSWSKESSLPSLLKIIFDSSGLIFILNFVTTIEYPQLNGIYLIFMRKTAILSGVFVTS